MGNVLSNFKKKIIDVVETGNLYIYGAGNLGKIYAKYFIKMNIPFEGFIDKNSDLWSTSIYGKHIYSLDKLKFTENDYILVSLSNVLYLDIVNDIRNMLMLKGVNESNILYYTGEENLISEMLLEVSEATKYIERTSIFKNMFKDRRCFIIGNGPSLTLDDLNKVSNEITMACNNAISLVGQCDWIPTCFFFEDHLFLEKFVKNKSDLMDFSAKSKYMFTSIQGNVYESIGDSLDNLYYYWTLKCDKQDLFSEEFDKYVYKMGTSLYAMEQLAVFMGIKEIYLLGVDYSFRQEVDATGKVTVNNDVKNHMELMDQMNHGRYRTDLIMRAHLTAKEYADTHGVKIYNATRGGKLEVFPRVNLDDLF